MSEVQSESVAVSHIKHVLKSQYKSAINTLREAINLCPDELWICEDYSVQCWQHAYHAAFFAHLYACRHVDEFKPWSKHIADVQVPDGIPGPPDPESDKPLIADPYSRQDVMEYCDFCSDFFDTILETTDVGADESGFYWYPVPKLEHLLVNIRHIQHHAAQIADRIRSREDKGIRWFGAALKKG